MQTAMSDVFSIETPGKFSRQERLRSRYAGLAYEPEEGWLGNVDADFSYDDLASSMEEIPTFSRGDVTTGSIIGYEPNGALVDIGVKSSAYVTVRHGPLVTARHSAHCLFHPRPCGRPA